MYRFIIGMSLLYDIFSYDNDVDDILTNFNVT